MRSPALAVTVAAAVVVGAALWSARPPAPRGPDAPPTEFSEGRAWPVLEHLARTKRVAGSPEADAALAYLEEQMRAIPGLEVEIQELTAYALGPYTGPSIYTVRNIVARLPGETDEAVLVAAHYDSAVMSHGAADDGIGCATVVEAARCLAEGPPLRRSVVFLLDEAEELGLFGAHGFLHHRWADDVVSYVNLEAAGCRGRPILFQTGPGDPWLAEAYARAAPRPHGTVLGQDVFQSGVIPSDTDFRVYRDDGGLRGLDVALYRDGWGYHTTRDRAERVERGSLQEMGENTLAVLRELAAMDLPDEHDATPAVYYDVLGRWMLAYSGPAAWLLALVALAGLVHALRGAGREARVGIAGWARGTAWAAGTSLVVIAVTLLLASLVDPLTGSVSGWYARPWLAVAAYGVPAAVLVLLAMRLAVLRARDSLDVTATALVGGTGVLAAVVLVAATVAGLGSAYLPLWWVAGATAAVRLVARGRLATGAIVGCAFPALLTVQAADALLVTFVPIAERMAGPMEHVIALLAAVPLALSALIPAAVAAAAPPRWGRAVLRAAAAGAVASLVAVAALHPYTEERPERREISIVQEVDVETGATSTFIHSFEGDAPEHAFTAARLVPLGESESADGASRRVRVRVEPNGAAGVRLVLPYGGVRRVTTEGGAVADRPRYETRAAHVDSWTLALVAPPRDGLELTLDVQGDGPVEVRVLTWHVEMPESIRTRIDALPSWTSPEPEVWVRSTERL